MNAIICSGYIFILYLLHLQQVAVADDGSYVPTENIVLSCGSSTSEFVQYDGRKWNGDIVSPNVPSDADTKSQAVRAPNTLQSIPEVPYMTARIFHSAFTYTFNVTPGPKFIRLHFYPASYINLNISNAFLSVSAANFTLLHNFSASLNADYFNLAYFIKEFIVHVSGSVLQLTFSPSYNSSHAFAFVNGIEVVSMPLNLYTMGGDDAPLPLVGHNKVVNIYNDTAMENLHRLNVGGEQIPPKYDTGMFRSWDSDEVYILGANIGIQFSNMSMLVSYSDNAPPYSSPADVYRTSRSMAPFLGGIVNLNYNLTWFFPIDSGFLYLVRLHFCEIDEDITKMNQVVFTIFLNNQTADEQFDVIGWGGKPGAAVHKDYVVMVPHVDEGKQDLWLDLHPNKDSKPMYYNSFLNGVEIFKLSNFGDKSLAGINPSENLVKAPHVAHFNKSSKKLKFVLIGCGLLAVVLPILLCLLLFRLKVIKLRRVVSWCGLTVHAPDRIEKAKKSSLCTQFSMQEIKLATNDFHEDLLIGSGGFGNVYKGSFTGGTTYVAIKRANPMSEQGVSEFETEILLLSQLRHHNLVSLLGYCNEDGEMILVYELMANGSLHHHLHLRQRDESTLGWIQRLEICIGVARGLHYLHTGTKHRIIHRDIKTTNILLDHNWVPKISDFGLSKAGYPSLVTTNVKGSIGYLDPECYERHKLSEKSDVYSLGVVLLEVLTARPAVSVGEDDDEHVNLAEWTMSCVENGNVEQIVDPKLNEKIIKECFELYLGVAMKCLAERGAERPCIGEVLENLVLAMHLQKNEGRVQNGNERINDNVVLQGNSDLTPGVEFSEIMTPIGR
ncbi:interleukin-1 receptor-associated kinase 4 [Vigna unguiculata]|uniref:non-specific serine/threonine protein kinase n=1 Tax=Vigna unguiculata TaxID=3917 RepID=A0A4D6LNS3_VIGUN|nr:interleukin-1 receptor-associated kinase 4 [Vigna unguiculata]